MTKVIVDFPGCDRIEAESGANGHWNLKLVSCLSVEKMIHELQSKLGADVTKWALPEGNSHSAMLVRELILKARGQWNFPYEHLELCHCRSVPTDVVDQAILSGAHSPERVRSQTSASSACGTCRPEIEKILAHRLKVY